MKILALALILSLPVNAQERVKENIKQLDGVQVEEQALEEKEAPVQKKSSPKVKAPNDKVRK